ncbi:LIC11966 family surface protein [Sanyastnella coralliicola]|uniref:LIC11966 family surface protein n=1 Tax=Sanyastnella coralliicola TaxID=3069118 RepID=UPI0027B8A9C9|nr:hypothetical protein [Longitalea sp. SCSIO 12813]
MLKKTLLFCAFAVILTSCESRSEKAAAYNDSLIEQQAYVLSALNELDSSLNKIDTTHIDEAYQILQGRIVESLRAVDEIGAFNKDESLYNATRELIQGYEGIVDGPYAELIDLISLPDSMFTPSKQLRAFEVEDDIINGVENLHNSFTKKQATFGVKYNVIFEEN